MEIKIKEKILKFLFGENPEKAKDEIFWNAMYLLGFAVSFVIIFSIVRCFAKLIGII